MVADNLLGITLNWLAVKGLEKLGDAYKCALWLLCTTVSRVVCRTELFESGNYVRFTRLLSSRQLVACMSRAIHLLRAFGCSSSAVRASESVRWLIVRLSQFGS